MPRRPRADVQLEHLLDLGKLSRGGRSLRSARRRFRNRSCAPVAFRERAQLVIADEAAVVRTRYAFVLLRRYAPSQERCRPGPANLEDMRQKLGDGVVGKG